MADIDGIELQETGKSPLPAKGQPPQTVPIHTRQPTPANPRQPPKTGHPRNTPMVAHPLQSPKTAKPSLPPKTGNPRQGGHPQEGYPQGGHPQGEYPQGGHPQGEYPQGEFPQGGYPHTGYPQGGYPQGWYPPTGGQGYPQGMYPPPGQPGYPQAGPPVIYQAQPHPSATKVPNIIAVYATSCLVFWFANPLFGAIGFCIARSASSAIKKSNIPKARSLWKVSLSVSIIGLVISAIVGIAVAVAACGRGGCSPPSYYDYYYGY